MYRNEHEANIGREEREELWREKEEEGRLMEKTLGQVAYEGRCERLSIWPLWGDLPYSERDAWEAAADAVIAAAKPDRRYIEGQIAALKSYCSDFNSPSESCEIFCAIKCQNSVCTRMIADEVAELEGHLAALPAAPVVDGDLVAQCEVALQSASILMAYERYLMEDKHMDFEQFPCKECHDKRVTHVDAALLAIARSRGRG